MDSSCGGPKTILKRRLDVTKVRQLPGRAPKIDLQSGLEMWLDYFRKAVSEESTTANSQLSSRLEIRICGKHLLKVFLFPPGIKPIEQQTFRRTE